MRPVQTVRNLKEQSDLSLHCLTFHDNDSDTSPSVHNLSFFRIIKYMYNKVSEYFRLYGNNQMYLT